LFVYDKNLILYILFINSSHLVFILNMTLRFAIVTVLLVGLLIISSCKKSVEPPEVEPVTLLPIVSTQSTWVDLCWTKFRGTGFKSYEAHYSRSASFAAGTDSLYCEPIVDRSDTTNTETTDLQPNTQYYFKIRVNTLDGRYSESNIQSARTDTALAVPKRKLF
jgi:hypothetical protein